MFQFEHPSVKDYPLSDRIQAGPAKAYGVRPEAANAFILNSCLAYLLSFTQSNFDAKATLKDFPLANYAALFWTDYMAPNLEPKTFTLLKRLFQEKSGSAYRNWLCLVSAADDSTRYANQPRCSMVRTLSRYKKGCYAPPLVWASALGLTSIVRHLLTTDASIDVNAPGVAVVSALAIATHQSHREIMELLLSHDGDVCAAHEEEDGRELEICRAPLYYAARYGHLKSLEILLRDRSRFGKPAWKLEVALEEAVDKPGNGAIDTVRRLIEAGVNVNAPSRDTGRSTGMKFSCVLDAASQRSSKEIVQLLLDAGADPNLHCGKYGLPLQTAAYWGRTAVVRLLLDAGADVKARSSPYGTALIAAAFRGCTEIVSMLLAVGANPTTQWDLHSVLFELNFVIYNFSSGQPYPSSDSDRDSGIWDPRDPCYEDLERNIESEILSTRVRRPAGDNTFGGEWELWQRSKASAAKFVMFGEFERRKALAASFGRLMSIRGAGRRIARRSAMAGVEVEWGRYMFSAMQAAVAGEWPGVVEVLRESGADVPEEVEGRVDEDEEELDEKAEAVARILRMRTSLDYAERTEMATGFRVRLGCCLCKEMTVVSLPARYLCLS
ncbi:hypothetical protein MMC13_008061 [Lambiella insularis]|nr:hypothetical protein [Lambiella insularis]